MRTVFCLFRDVNEAKMAIDELVEKKFPRGEMNLIVQEQVAKNEMTINPRSSAIPVTGNGSGDHIPDLERMLHGKKPVTLADTGRVLVAGELAKIMTNTAASPNLGEAEGGLKAALMGFGVNRKHAAQFHTGVKEGGVLFFLRTDDDRSSEVAACLRNLDGDNFVSSV